MLVLFAFCPLFIIRWSLLNPLENIFVVYYEKSDL